MIELNKQQEEVIMISILVASSVSDITNKTKKVSKLEKTIKDNLYNMFKTNEDLHYINRFGFPATKKKLSKQYIDLEEKVRDAWLKTRQEHIPKDSTWYVSMSEMITQLLNSLNMNPYQYMLVSEKITLGAINSFASHIGGRETTMDDYNNARALAFGFRDNVGIKKNPLLRRLAINAKNNLILEQRI